MKITKYIHSCVLVEEEGTSILFDPGMFTFMDSSVTPELFKNVSLIVLTHNHPDHVDIESIKKIADLSGALVLTTPEIKTALRDADFITGISTDTEYEVGAFKIKAVPAAHEAILSTTLPTNYGYLVNGRLLHPGDSFGDALTTTGAEILLLPITAPWTTELGVFEFAKKVAPKTVLPIHDGYVKDFFQTSRYQNFDKNFDAIGIKFMALQKPGDSVEL